MFTKQFWVASSERALKTFAQVLVTVLGAEQFNLISADWVGILAMVATAVLLSFATSISSARLTPERSPAAFGKERTPNSAPVVSGKPVGVLNEL